jgi:hypothetical protein
MILRCWTRNPFEGAGAWKRPCLIIKDPAVLNPRGKSTQAPAVLNVKALNLFCPAPAGSSFGFRSEFRVRKRRSKLTAIRAWHPIGCVAITSLSRYFPAGPFWSTARDEAWMCVEIFWRNCRWREQCRCQAHFPKPPLTHLAPSVTRQTLTPVTHPEKSGMRT